MAKRMFSDDITSSDAFLDMPDSSQNLYFHLGMRADDDGFVNPNITMRMIGANNDDLKILIAKRFLLQFENGVVVVKHWRINNFIRKDRYKPTNYIDEKNMLRVKENMAYTLDEGQGENIGLVPWKSDQERRSTNGQPMVNAGKVRIGKVRIVKETSARTPKKDSLLADFEDVWSIYPRKVGKGGARKAWEKIPMTPELVAQIKKSVEDHKRTEQWSESPKYIPHFATFLNQERWTDEVEVKQTQKPAIIIS